MFRQLIISSAVALAAATAQADHWPQVHHDASRQGRSPDEVRDPYELRWVAEFPQEALATRVEAIVTQQHIFVGTLQGNLWCLDRRTGREVWKHRASGPIVHSPACSDDLVICGDAGGTLWALDQGTGNVVWRFRSGKGGFVASPLVTSEGIYVGSRDGNFYALTHSGHLLFKSATGGPIRNTAAKVGEVIVFASDDMHAYAIDPASGELKWRSGKLQGQSFRDYYPVELPGGCLMLRSVLVEEMNDELNGGTQVLQKLAGIADGWKPLDEFLKSDANHGTEQKIRTEQDAMLARLEENSFRRTCFLLDAATGREAAKTPVWYLAGNGGCGIPPVVAADGRTLLLYRTVYSNWSRGVKPCVGLGSLQMDGRIEPIRHRSGNSPPWNTFWGTSDESTNLSIGGDLLYFTHQGTLSSLDLKTLELRHVWGNRDTWGGLQTPLWAANEWHGPARGSVAIAGNELFWVTGSRVLCIEGNLKRQPRPPAKSAAFPPAEVVLEPGTRPLNVERMIDEPVAWKQPATLSSPLHAELEREVAELLDGDPWAPLYLQMGIGSRDFFFAHPSFELHALAQAFPFLEAQLGERAKSRMEELLPACLQSQSLPLDKGQRRELYDLFHVEKLAIARQAAP